MKLIDSLKFCSWAVAKKNFVESLTHFKISGGRIQSFNGSISLSSPIDLNLDCQPIAAKFLKTIQSCSDTVQITMTPAGKLSIKSGNTRALVDCTQEPFPEILPEGPEMPVSGAFIEALALLEPMIAEDASRPWARGILFTGNRAYATNNVILAQVELDGTFAHPINIPHAAVNELLRIKKYPSHMQLAENSVTFHYDDGRWLRTALLSVEWPDLNRVLNPDPMPTTFVKLEDEFWQALEDLKIHVDEYRRIRVVPNYLTTSLDHENASYSKVNGMPKCDASFNIDMLLMLKGIATSIDFNSYPAPCLWVGEEGLRGAIVGMRDQDGTSNSPT